MDISEMDISEMTSSDVSEIHPISDILIFRYTSLFTRPRHYVVTKDNNLQMSLSGQEIEILRKINFTFE
jgi:hypothetical protein